jgi:hypothetical protein
VNADESPARRPRQPGRTSALAGAGAAAGAASRLHSPMILLCLAVLALAALSMVSVLALLAVLPRRRYCREAAERILRLLLIDTRTPNAGHGRQ